MNSPTQEAMRDAAIDQARDRRDRTGDTMTVYRKHNVWYVRSNAEGRPDGSGFIIVFLGSDYA